MVAVLGHYPGSAGLGGRIPLLPPDVSGQSRLPLLLNAALASTKVRAQL
jgi:hypothetical protein